MTQPTHRPAGKRPGRPGASASNSTTTSTPLSPSTKRPVSISGRSLRAARRRRHAVRRDHPRHQGTHSIRVPHLHQSSSDTVMTLAGTARCVAYLMGNHVTAETMCRHDPTAMLYMPMRNVTRDATTNRPGSLSTSRAVSSAPSATRPGSVPWAIARTRSRAEIIATRRFLSALRAPTLHAHASPRDRSPACPLVHRPGPLVVARTRSSSRARLPCPVTSSPAGH